MKKYIDCAEMPSDSGCTICISGEDEDDVLDVAVQHAVSKHGHEDTPELREVIKGMLKDDRSFE